MGRRRLVCSVPYTHSSKKRRQIRSPEYPFFRLISRCFAYNGLADYYCLERLSVLHIVRRVSSGRPISSRLRRDVLRRCCDACLRIMGGWIRIP